MGTCLHGFAAIVSLGALAACGVVETDDTEAADAPDTVASGEASEACSGIDAETGELLPYGDLIQVDLQLRYEASRHNEFSADDVSWLSDVASSVDGTSSQLACMSERYGYTQFRFRPYRDRQRPAFPVVTHGTAWLKGSRTHQASGATILEEADISGPLERLAIDTITVRDQTNADEVCVMLEFFAPLSGSAVRTITAPGLSRREDIDPDVLVGDSYSAMSVRSYDGDTHEFGSGGLTICAGTEDPTDRVVGYVPPDGLQISPDEKVWTRDGPWAGHLSGPAEKRSIHFRMEIVPRTLDYPPAP